MPFSNIQNPFASNGQLFYVQPAMPYQTPTAQPDTHSVLPHGLLPGHPDLPDFDVLFGNKEPETEPFTSKAYKRKAYKRKTDTNENPAILKRLLTKDRIQQGYKS